MMSRNLILAIGILCIPFIYLALTWGSMPDQVALHFGADGQPDRYGPKSELFIALGIISAVGLLAFGLIQWLPTIDPKKNLETSSTTLFKIGFSLVVFMAILNIYIIYSATHATKADWYLYCSVPFLRCLATCCTVLNPIILSACDCRGPLKVRPTGGPHINLPPAFGLAEVLPLPSSLCCFPSNGWLVYFLFRLYC